MVGLVRSFLIRVLVCYILVSLLLPFSLNIKSPVAIIKTLPLRLTTLELAVLDVAALVLVTLDLTAVSSGATLPVLRSLESPKAIVLFSTAAIIRPLLGKYSVRIAIGDHY